MLPYPIQRHSSHTDDTRTRAAICDRSAGFARKPGGWMASLSVEPSQPSTLWNSCSRVWVL